MEPDNPPDRLQHEAFFRSLGPLPCTVTTVNGTYTGRGLREAVNEWLTKNESNLLVLSGAFGAGKSSCMQQLATDAGIDARLVDFARQTIPDARVPEKIVLLDHFDAVTLATGVQNGPPDLREIQPLLLASHRVAIATGRPLSDKGHELVRQLRYRARREALGVRDPYLIEILPWGTSQVLQASRSLGDPASNYLSNIFSTLDDRQAADLKRPMVLQMLIDVVSEMRQDWIPEMGDVYDQYLERSLSRDYDMGHSLLNASLKQEILSQLAYDIFSNREAQLDTGTGLASSISLSIVEKRVGSVVSGRGKPLSVAGYDATTDFLDTNRVGGLVDGAAFAFDHPVFYEYFLGTAVSNRYSAGLPLGIDGRRFSPALLDSLAVYFAKRRLDTTALRKMENMLSNDSLEWPDRMVILYLLEDIPRFFHYLSTSPDSYLDQIRSAATQTNWHFLAKIAKFQLVSLGAVTADDYLDYVQRAEQPQHRNIEIHMTRDPSGNVGYLMRRFRNPELRRSAAIALYRIAQLDMSTAEEALKLYGPNDPDARLACERALQRVRTTDVRSPIV